MSITQVKREKGHATDGVLRAINEIAISNAQRSKVNVHFKPGKPMRTGRKR
jgi:siroheme synthase